MRAVAFVHSVENNFLFKVKIKAQFLKNKDVFWCTIIVSADQYEYFARSCSSGIKTGDKKYVLAYFVVINIFCSNYKYYVLQTSLKPSTNQSSIFDEIDLNWSLQALLHPCFINFYIHTDINLKKALVFCLFSPFNDKLTDIFEELC